MKLTGVFLNSSVYLVCLKKKWGPKILCQMLPFWVPTHDDKTGLKPVSRTGFEMGLVLQQEYFGKKSK